MSSCCITLCPHVVREAIRVVFTTLSLQSEHCFFHHISNINSEHLFNRLSLQTKFAFRCSCSVGGVSQMSVKTVRSSTEFDRLWFFLFTVFPMFTIVDPYLSILAFLEDTTDGASPFWGNHLKSHLHHGKMVADGLSPMVP